MTRTVFECIFIFAIVKFTTAPFSTLCFTSDSYELSGLLCTHDHAGIDGFSRLVTYLKCSDNNCASTVLVYFRNAIEIHGLPSRIRCDYGVENVDMAYFMLTVRGTGRGSVLTGSSTHNQRIERLWRDVSRVVLRQYKNLFNYLEAYCHLNCLNDMDLCALHYVFMPRINHTLEEFVRQYNNHPLRTEHNLTPRQLHSVSPVTTTVQETMIDPNSYGIEEDGPVPNVESPNNCVIVDPVNFTIPEDIESMLPDPLTNDGNYGIDTYLEVLAILQRFCM